LKQLRKIVTHSESFQLSKTHCQSAQFINDVSRNYTLRRTAARGQQHKRKKKIWSSLPAKCHAWSTGRGELDLHENGITRRYALEHVSTHVLHPCQAFGN
jgi:hypothetical protein